MKVIITGGTGLIGQALIKEFSQNGYEVIILSRNPEKTRSKIIGAAVVYWDGRTQGDWVNHIDGADAVVNLAGASIAGDNILKMRWTVKRKAQILGSRVNAGKTITEAIKSVENKPAILVQSSAVGIYGPLGDEIVDESHPLADDYLANVCRDWEKSTKDVEALGVRRVVIRTGLVFSKEGGIFPLLRFPFSLFVGGPLGRGNQYISWIHIDDAAGAIRHLVEDQHAVGTYNLTSPDPVTNKVFSLKMGKGMRRPAFLPVPSIAMKLALGEVSTLALDGQRVVPSRLLECGYQFKYIKLANALDDLLQPLHHFRHSFNVKSEKEKVSAFHEDTKVLKQLTPFPIIVQFKQVEPVGEGSRAIFTLWFGPIPVNWEAVHHDFDRGNGFNDTQEKGPFNYWFHQHSFLSVNATTTDVVDEITAAFGKGLFSWVVSRFMWVTLPILFAFRGWQTKRLVEKK